MITRKRAALLLRLSGPLLLLLFLIPLDLKQIGLILGRMEPSTWIWALLCCLPILPLRAWRWFLLLEPPRPPFREVLAVYAHSVLLGTITPGGLGEFGKAFYLKSRRYGTGFAFWVTLWDRLLDLIVLSLVAFAFLLSSITIPPANWAVIGLFSALVALCFAWGKSLRARLTGILSHGQNRFVNRGFGFPGAASLWPGLALSTTAWLLNWTAVWILAQAMDLTLSPLFIGGLMACVVCASLLPVTVLGLGTRDAVLLYFLLPLGLIHEEILALSAAVLALRLGYAMLCLGFLLLLPEMKPTLQPGPDRGGESAKDEQLGEQAAQPLD